MIPQEVKWIADAFFLAHSDEYDLSTQEGCGQYLEAFVVEAQNKGYRRVGHLRKTGSATQYNGHAIDSFLYKEAVGEFSLYQSVDIIGDAETDHARASFGVDIPRYKESDWLEKPDSGNSSPSKTVPWVAYNENGFQRLKNMLEHDYKRRPQGPDYDVSVWAGRYFHNCYMGPEGKPLGEQAALERVKKEVCLSLGVPVDGYLG